MTTDPVQTLIEAAFRQQAALGRIAAQSGEHFAVAIAADGLTEADVVEAASAAVVEAAEAAANALAAAGASLAAAEQTQRITEDALRTKDAELAATAATLRTTEMGLKAAEESLRAKECALADAAATIERLEREQAVGHDRADAYWRSYTYGVPGAVEAVYPRAHLVDAAFRDSEECDLRQVPSDHWMGCLGMLAAGWVPDSLGKPGSPAIGLAKDPDKADRLRRAMLKAISESPRPAKVEAAEEVARFMARWGVRFTEGHYPDSTRMAGDPAHLGFVGVVVDRGSLGAESEKFLRALAVLRAVHEADNKEG
jgi:hypothetical protein